MDCTPCCNQPDSSFMTCETVSAGHAMEGAVGAVSPARKGWKCSPESKVEEDGVGGV